MSKRKRLAIYRLFEVCIGTNPDINAPENHWVCVKASPVVMPSKAIMTKFLADELSKTPGESVQGICIVSLEDAKERYDCSNIDNWPMLGGDIETDLF